MGKLLFPEPHRVLGRPCCQALCSPCHLTLNSPVRFCYHLLFLELRPQGRYLLMVGVQYRSELGWIRTQSAPLQGPQHPPLPIAYLSLSFHSWSHPKLSHELPASPPTPFPGELVGQDGGWEHMLRTVPLTPAALPEWHSYTPPSPKPCFMECRLVIRGSRGKGGLYPKVHRLKPKGSTSEGIPAHINLLWT